ncbi:hypothetical protein [Shewanella acanthi]|uniref:hypothetical protein n=1 Tax=Shewanella acanthi TaxID=2864212 RepID=UPI001C661699|nr:hypothetical protein [Shewanella acanthi]QYJ79862.1 hypothetical protein K0H61_05435 [Shewanella acanthi]
MNSIDAVLKKAAEYQMQGTAEQLMEVWENDENPKLQFVAEFLITALSHDWLGSYVYKLLPNSEDSQNLSHNEIIERLAVIDNISDLVDLTAEDVANLFFDFATKFPLAAPEKNSRLLEKFTSAKTLSDAFKEHDQFQHYEDLLHLLEEREADILHAALSCEMAGLEKAANTLKKELTVSLFSSKNRSLQKIKAGLFEAIGKRNSVKKAAKAGNDSKHAINRTLKADAVKLYKAGKFHSARHAARQLLPQVAAISEQRGSPLEWHTNGFDRLYKWLLASDKDK